MSDVGDRLTALFAEILEEADSNPSFARRVERALSADLSEPKPRRGARRAPGAIDPFAVQTASGADELRRELSRLTIEQLKDIVAQHGMDNAKLAMKWKATERLIELIMSTVDQRLRKGDAFFSRGDR